VCSVVGIAFRVWVWEAGHVSERHWVYCEIKLVAPVSWRVFEPASYEYEEVSFHAVLERRYAGCGELEGDLVALHSDYKNVILGG